MAEITRRIVLYNAAYSLAWEALPERVKTASSSISKRLDQAIWSQIRDGGTDARLIAEAAVTALLLREQ